MEPSIDEEVELDKKTYRLGSCHVVVVLLSNLANRSIDAVVNVRLVREHTHTHNTFKNEQKTEPENLTRVRHKHAQNHNREHVAD